MQKDTQKYIRNILKTVHKSKFYEKKELDITIKSIVTHVSENHSEQKDDKHVKNFLSQ